ncbi:MAG: MGMT family protein [Acidimicrobiales bacterium]
MAASRKPTSVTEPDAGPTAGLTEFEAAVVTVLLATEPGDVMAYGEVAAEAGYPGAARAVGNVLKQIDDLPWWRVVNAAGRLIPHNTEEQAKRLAAEGVATANGRVQPAH